jgi:DNA-binding IclR family transcriptional regulator
VNPNAKRRGGTPAPKRNLMTVRQVSETYGLPQATAESLVRVLAREGRLYRFQGLRRVFVDRDDVEAKLQASTPSSSSGGVR